MAQIFYVSMVDKKYGLSFQVTRAYPTWLGCKRVLNRLRSSHPSVLFRMDFVECYRHEEKRYLKEYNHHYDFDKTFSLLYETGNSIG